MAFLDADYYLVGDGGSGQWRNYRCIFVKLVDYYFYMREGEKAIMLGYVLRAREI